MQDRTLPASPPCREVYRADVGRETDCGAVFLFARSISLRLYKGCVMAVSVYKGIARSGLARRVGWYKDGALICKVEVVAGSLVVTTTGNRELYDSGPIPELDNYAVQSVGCLRSGTTGTLVVILGGFYAGTSGQQALTINTPHPIHEEITYEQYLAGRR